MEFVLKKRVYCCRCCFTLSHSLSHTCFGDWTSVQIISVVVVVVVVV